MKTEKRKVLLATAAALLAATIGGTAPIATKIALLNLSPFPIVFIRLGLMTVLFLPLFYKKFGLMFAYPREVLLLSILWCGNMFLFNLGIKYTTVVMSQLLFTGVPILLFLENIILGKEKPHRTQVIGLTSAFIGIFTLIVYPERSSFSLGTWYGNLLIFTGSVCYAAYILIISRNKQKISAPGLTVISSGIGTVVAFLLMSLTGELNQIRSIFSVPVQSLWALVYLATVAGVVMWTLYNWGNKHAIPIVSGSALYMTTFTSAILGTVLLGERITLPVVAGGSLLLAGVFLVATVPILRKELS